VQDSGRERVEHRVQDVPKTDRRFKLKRTRARYERTDRRCSRERRIRTWTSAVVATRRPTARFEMTSSLGGTGLRYERCGKGDRPGVGTSITQVWGARRARPRWGDRAGRALVGRQRSRSNDGSITLAHATMGGRSTMASYSIAVVTACRQHDIAAPRPRHEEDVDSGRSLSQHQLHEVTREHQSGRPITEHRGEAA